ncbi:MAG: cysteine--tRNA ligase [Candidatus Omnitrophota bacterium]
MALKLYNTLTRTKENFEPLLPGRVSMYVCGPTVYDVPHIGHARSAYVFDVARKYFRYKGYDVVFVRNVTDIDDKIIARAADDLRGSGKAISDTVLSEASRAVAEKYLDVYHRQLDMIGIEPPTHEPRATQNIDEMIKFTAGLIEKGYAYVSDGNVYFSVNKFEGYGKLSNRNKDELLHGVRKGMDEKKEHPLDFALWKASKSGEPFWDSPWGPGRPGWHIECSVMSTKLLGDRFDIHGGGIDLIFPHHENEIAQSEAATGKAFSRYWMHNGLLTVCGEKMSKSLGNYITISDLLLKYPDPDMLKISFASSHYRSPVDHSDEKMEEAGRAKERILNFMDRVYGAEKVQDRSVSEESFGADGLVRELRDEFDDAMNDDLNTALALAVIFKAVKAGNDILSGNAVEDKAVPGKLSALRDFVKECSGILGLTLRRADVEGSLKQEVSRLIEERNNARDNKDYKKADAIRAQLSQLGIKVEDTSGGSEWKKK